MKLISRLAGLAVLASIGAAASAQDVIATVTNQWEGFYAGANIGGAWNTTCNTWEQSGLSVIPPNAFYNRNCPNNSTFIGGVQIGYNFQYNQWVWGFGLDYEIWSSKSKSRSYTYTGPTPPPDGTYTISGKGSPNGLILLGPRIAYAVDNWLPYFRIGGAFTSGQSNITASFTDPTGTASFNGGKNFKANGLGVGVGTDVMIADSLFLRLDYTYLSLSKGSNTVTSCTGTAATCAEYGNISLDNIHNKFTASLVRVGLSYKF